MDIKKATGLVPAIAAASAAVLADFIKRDDIVRATWLALVSDSAAFFLGPPGVAKTATVQRLSREVEGMVFFEALMPAIVSADQLFVESTFIEERELAGGGKSIAVANTLGRAAKAHVVFADEIWKTEPAVLQPMLDLARADGVRHEGDFVHTPILAFLAASNELPEEGGKLDAMWSRMIVRVDVRGLDRSGRKVMIESRLRQARAGQAAAHSSAVLTVEDVQLLQQARPHVRLPDEIVEAILDIIEELSQKDAEGFRWLVEDDRRFGFVCDVLQANALIHGREVVGKQDLAVLEWMLWNTPEQIGVVKSVIAPYIRTPAGEARELIDALLAGGGNVEVAFKGNDMSKATAALRQCRDLKDTELPRLKVEAAGTSDETQIQKWIEALMAFMAKLGQKVAGIGVGSWEEATKDLS